MLKVWQVPKLTGTDVKNMVHVPVSRRINSFQKVGQVVLFSDETRFNDQLNYER
jgi:hypothetical protein